MLFLCFHRFSLPFIIILFAGQTFSHFPHPTHLSSATFAKQPLCTLIAPIGQAFSQAPQATQIVLSTAANRLDAIFIPPILVCFIAVYHILTAVSVTRSHSKNIQNIEVISYVQYSLEERKGCRMLQETAE